MKFNDTKFSKELLLYIGIEEDSGRYFLSFPVTSPMHVDYEEYYEISKEEYHAFFENLEKAQDLAKRCRERLEDSRLFLPPANPRGIPW